MYYYMPQNNQPQYNYPYNMPPEEPEEEPKKEGRVASIILTVFACIMMLGAISMFVMYMIFAMEDYYYDDLILIFFWVGIAASAVSIFLIFIALLVKKQIGITIILTFAMLILTLLIYFHYSSFETGHDQGGYQSYYTFKNAHGVAQCEYPWSIRGEDWSFIALDSNPNDVNSAEPYKNKVSDAIKTLNKYFDLPDTLYYEFFYNTDSSMGKQTKTFESKGVEVSWSYSANKGLEVIYSRIIE